MAGLDENNRSSELLRRACELFVSVGFDAFNVDILREDLGSHESRLLDTYDSKHVLFDAVYDEIAGAGLHVLIATMMVPGSPSERIHQSARAMAHFFLEDPARGHFFCIVAPAVQGRCAEHREDVLAGYVDALVSGTRLMGNTDLTDLQLRICARALIAASEVLIAEGLRAPQTVSRVDVVRALSHLCRSVAGVGLDIS